MSNKGFAATTIVLGVGSYTYQFNTRDTFGFAAKGSWFSTSDGKEYSIYKDPITDDGTKKSLRGMIRVNEDFSITQECTKEQEKEGILRVIFEDGKYFNKTTLTEIRSKLSRVN